MLGSKVGEDINGQHQEDEQTAVEQLQEAINCIPNMQETKALTGKVSSIQKQIVDLLITHTNILAGMNTGCSVIDKAKLKSAVQDAESIRKAVLKEV